MRDSRWNLASGSGATLLIIVLGLISVLTLALGTGLQQVRVESRVQAIADNAAIAAADTLVGILAGFPCENAEEIALKNGADLISCRIVSSVVSVSVGSEHRITSVIKDARARPASADF